MNLGGTQTFSSSQYTHNTWSSIVTKKKSKCYISLAEITLLKCQISFRTNNFLTILPSSYMEK